MMEKQTKVRRKGQPGSDSLESMVLKHGFAAVIEVAAGMPYNEFYSDFSRKKEQAVRSKKFVLSETHHKAEVANGFSFYWPGKKYVSPGELDFVITIQSYDTEILERAYKMMLQNHRFREPAQRMLAAELYFHRQRVSLGQVQGKTKGWKYDFERAAGPSYHLLVGHSDVVRGVAAEYYVHVLVSDYLKEYGVLHQIKFQQPDFNSRGEQYGVIEYDVDLIFACPKQDFKQALDRIADHGAIVLRRNDPRGILRD